jgi:hypothetical protein
MSGAFIIIDAVKKTLNLQDSAFMAIVLHIAGGYNLCFSCSFKCTTEINLLYMQKPT